MPKPSPDRLGPEPVQTSAKAHAAAASVLVMAALARVTGLVETPPIEELGDALRVVVVETLLPMAVAWIGTWMGPRNRDKEE